MAFSRADPTVPVVPDQLARMLEDVDTMVDRARSHGLLASPDFSPVPVVKRRRRRHDGQPVSEVCRTALRAPSHQLLGAATKAMLFIGEERQHRWRATEAYVYNALRSRPSITPSWRMVSALEQATGEKLGPDSAARLP